jgi:hypothetical protein
MDPAGFALLLEGVEIAAYRGNGDPELHSEVVEMNGAVTMKVPADLG